MIKDMQDGAFQAGSLGEFRQHAGRHRPAAERAPVGMPPGDCRVQVAFLLLHAMRRGEADAGQQQRLVGIGKELHHRLAAGHGGCQPHIEQRRTAGDMDGATARVAVPQRTPRVGA